MWRKLNDVLFCNYNSTWCYVIMHSAESRSVCVYVHSILFIVSWNMNDCQNTINRFNPGIFCACLKARPGYPTSYVLVVFFYVKWIEARGDCSSCWYWLNCWPSLFKLPFHIQVSTKVFYAECFGILVLASNVFKFIGILHHQSFRDCKSFVYV
jgi:hypothetical protein